MLQHLLEIRDRRLYENHESPYCMQSVCQKNPTTLPEDLDCVGYRCQCYQRFTGQPSLSEQGSKIMNKDTIPGYN